MIIATFDFETDPFKYGRPPKPFACGFYDGQFYKQWWSDNCVFDFFDFLKKSNEQYKIYAHNGGKFDFWFLMQAQLLDSDLKIINGRVVEAHIAGHVLRDSFAIMPFGLSKYQKTIIDYKKFEIGERDQNKKEISNYLKDDCVYLYDLVDSFREKFGDKLTIGGAAMYELKKRHETIKTGRSHDEKFRPYYFGGRVQAFDTGVVNKELTIYDVNSMYPFVMSSYNHPIGEDYILIKDFDFNEHFTDDGYYIDDKMLEYFITIEGVNRGALPFRTEKMGIDFNVEKGIFKTTGHELRVALKHGLIKINRVVEARVCLNYSNYNDFVQFFMAEKIEAKLMKDKINELLSKLILNNAYGKFGQSPDNFYTYQLIYMDENPLQPPWHQHIDADDYEIYRKPSGSYQYNDVAIAASITGAARSVLLDALIKSEGAVYCDTDSIICESLPGVVKHTTMLGAWDNEGDGNCFCCGGKKLYALFGKNGECVKMASKGARLVPNDIINIANNNDVLWTNDAPSFKLDLSVHFVHRTIKKRE